MFGPWKCLDCLVIFRAFNRVCPCCGIVTRTPATIQDLIDEGYADDEIEVNDED